MSYATEQIALTLKAARQAKGLSQRVLSKTAGVPQSHISKIEQGAVDLRLSSLVEIARVLDLEMMLVPRKAVPAIESITRGARKSALAAAEPSVVREFKRLEAILGAALSEHPGMQEIAQLAQQVRELKQLALPVHELQKLRDAVKAVKGLTVDTGEPGGIRKAIADIQELRNAAIHSMLRLEPVRSAYDLAENDHG